MFIVNFIMFAIVIGFYNIFHLLKINFISFFYSLCYVMIICYFMLRYDMLCYVMLCYVYIYPLYILY